MQNHNDHLDKPAETSTDTSVAANVRPLNPRQGDYSAPVPFIGVLDESFGDATALFNSRAWLQSALEAKGAKMTGGGCGFGQADIDIELEGCKFNVSIRPI